MRSYKKNFRRCQIHKNNKINTLNESSIHNEIKIIYSKPLDIFESEIDGYIIDIIRKKLLIEIQTKNFGNIKVKIKKLLDKHKVLIVHNIPVTKWIIKLDENHNVISRKKSPKKGNFYNIFKELIYITEIIKHKNFSLEILMTEEEEVRVGDGKGSWRRKGVSIKDRNLTKIIDKKYFKNINDYLFFIKDFIDCDFTTKDLMEKYKLSRSIANKTLYVLKKIDLIKVVGKKGNLLIYHVDENN